MEFVTFEIAKKLKGLGFNEPFFFFYRADDKDKKVHHVFLSKPLIYCGAIDDKFIIAPTISQVLKWLREEKKIFIEIALSPEGYRRIIYTGLYSINTSSISYYSFDDFYNPENNYKTYELAAIEGVKYVLDNLI